jgi:transposase
MGRKRTGMKTIREIIRLRLENQMGDRKIGRTTGVSRTVVARTLAQFRASGLSWEAVERMSDTELERTLWEKDRLLDSPRYRALEGRFAAMVQELKKKGMTLEWLWNQYREEHPEGYQYSQFCRHFQRWSAAGELWMHQEYKAGERMFSDWAGQPLVVLNANTGQDWPLDVFVGILAASGLTWVQAHESQQLPCWIRSHVAALGYFEGSPEAVSPDNVRTAVSKADRYEPEINPVFDEFAQHYHMAVFPARVGRPQDKALAENAVLLVYQRVYVPLRGRSFRSLQEVNEAIRELLEKHNNRPLQRLGISRRELFERTERAALRALPPEPFVLKDVQIATVGANYHVELREDRHYYSVPYHLRKKDPPTRVKIVYDQRIVAIYWQNVRVAQHPRVRSPNRYSTLPEHMPPNHRFYAEWSPQRFLGWAEAVGPQTRELVAGVLEAASYPPQAFRSCLGILALAKKHGSPRLEKACRKALRIGTKSYTRIKNILTQGLEEENQPQLDLGPLPLHENLRGGHYYN